MLAVLSFFSLSVARLVISPIVPAIIDAFDVSKGLIGLALTGLWGTYALLQFPSGVLADRFGERALILAALGLTTVGSVVVALSPSYLYFALFVGLMGAGAGLYFSVAASLLTKLFENTGQALGLHSAGAPIAGLLAPVAAAAVATQFGWRAAIVLGAAVTGPVFLLAAWRIRPTPPERPELRLRDRFDLSVLVELLSRPAIAYTTLLATVAAFSFQSFASFFPTFLVEYWDLPLGEASLVFGGVFLLTAAGLPLLGRLSDALDRDAVLAVVLALNASGFVLVLAGSGIAVLLVGAGALGLGLSFTGVLQSRFMDNLSVAEQGTGFGLVRTVYMFLSATGNVVTGVLAETAGWPTAYGFVAALSLLAVLSLGAVRLSSTRF